MLKSFPIKPAYGQPCNGCGWCCIKEICSVGKIVYPDFVAPCPGLVHDRAQGRTFCKLVLIEKATHMDPVVADTLAIGEGCDAATPEEIESWPK